MIKEISKGFLFGIIIPITLVGITYLFFLNFNKNLNIDIIISVILLGIGINALLIRRFFKKDKDYLGRGMMIASFVYFFYILIQYLFIP